MANMFKKVKHSMLEATSGSQMGKRYQLKKGEYAIGSHKKCQIKISGDYVSDLHAVLTQTPDGWTLTNNSPNGTYVNSKQIDTIALDQISTIQIGAENSFEFCPESLLTSNARNSNKDGSNGKDKKSYKWPLIIGGMVAVYLPAFIYLQNLSKTAAVVAVAPQVIALSEIDIVATESDAFLSSFFGDTEAEENTGQDNANFRGSDYDRLLIGAYQDEKEKKELIEQLVQKSELHLITAHHYFQMKLNKKALGSLRNVMALVPDHRYPAFKYAAKSISAINAIPAVR